jgi:N-acetylglucosamine-6-sulfatase
MKNQTLILLLFLLCGNVLFAQNSKDIPKLQALAAQQRMNVIFILTDDHRNDFMGFTGKIPWLKTPAMDKMNYTTSKTTLIKCTT